MTIQQIERGIEPTDQVESIGAPDDVATDDTEAHSLLTVELGRTIQDDRNREMAKVARDSNARVHNAGSKDLRSLLDRFRRI